MKIPLYPELPLTSIKLPSPPLWKYVLRPHVELLTAHLDLPFCDYVEAPGCLTLLEYEVAEAEAKALQVVGEGQEDVQVYVSKEGDL
jgi:hypothetical protein